MGVRSREESRNVPGTGRSRAGSQRIAGCQVFGAPVVGQSGSVA